MTALPVPRHLLVAPGRKGTLLPEANKILERMGYTLRDWQVEPWAEMWVVGADGRLLYGSSGVTMTAPRQMGKTLLIILWVLVYCQMFPRAEVLWSSHHGTTTTSTLRDMIDILESANMAHRPVQSVGREELFIDTGFDERGKATQSHIRFGSRERGLGRGLHGIDVIVADEIQKASQKFLETSLAAMNSSLSPLGSVMIGMGTAPEGGPEAELFLRTYADAIPDGVGEFAGRAPSADGTLLIDFGAPADTQLLDGDAIYEPSVIAQANPEFEVSVPMAVFTRARQKLSRMGFLREYLNVFTATAGSMAVGELFGDPMRYVGHGLHGDRLLSLGAAVSPDESEVALSAVWRDDRRGEFVATVGSWPSIPAAAPRIAQFVQERGAAVQLDGGGPAGPLSRALEEFGVYAVLAADLDGDMLRGLRKELSDGVLLVPAEDELMIASMRTVKARSRESGGALLSRRTGQPAPVEAAMQALDGARQSVADGRQEFF